jgi:hypothetical protein
MKVKGIFAVAIAIASGILVLAGAFAVAPMPPLIRDTLIYLRSTLLNWAIILAAFAVLAGMFNLLQVHFNKVRRGQKGRAYSAVLIICLLTTFLFGLVLGPDQPGMIQAFRAIQLPVEASLMGLLAVTLIYASIRLVRRRPSLFSVVFLIFALLALLAAAPLPFLGSLPGLGEALRPWVTGGARGILLGVALGALTTGLRVLFGADRPYGGK